MTILLALVIAPFVVIGTLLIVAALFERGDDVTHGLRFGDDF